MISYRAEDLRVEGLLIESRKEKSDGAVSGGDGGASQQSERLETHLEGLRYSIDCYRFESCIQQAEGKDRV